MQNILAAALLFSFLPALSPAQSVTPLPVSLGMQTDGDTNTSYAVNASGGPEQNLQAVQLLITRVEVGKSSTATTKTAITLRTGRQKTVAQLTAVLSEVFGKFLAGATPGTVIATLGSVEKGGAVDFVAESADLLRFTFKAPNAPVKVSTLNKADVAALAAILAG